MEPLIGIGICDGEVIMESEWTYGTMTGMENEKESDMTQGLAMELCSHGR